MPVRNYKHWAVKLTVNKHEQFGMGCIDTRDLHIDT